MSLKSLVRAMAPVAPKRQLVDSITKTQQQLVQHVIPAYEKSVEFVAGKSFNSNYAKVLDARYKDFNSLNNPRKNFIETTLDVLKLVAKNEEYVLAQVNAKFKDSVATEAFNFKELTLVNYQSALTHITEYSMRMLNLFWTAEHNVLQNKPQFDGVLKGEHDYVQDNLALYLRELATVNISRDALEKTIDQISDSIFDPDEEETVRSLLDPQKIDPMSFGFIPLPINPFYKIGRWWVEREDRIYKATQLDLQRVEIRIKACQEIQANTPNPTTEKTLKALDGLRHDLQLKLNKME